MPTLWTKRNYRNIRLDVEGAPELVGALAPDGSIHMLWWQGFIAAAVARQMPGARSVRLMVTRIDDEQLASDRYVLGCRVKGNVWAVIDHQVRLVEGPERERR